MQKRNNFPLSKYSFGISILAFCIFVLISFQADLAAADESVDLSWDHMVFAQSWPITDCIDHQEKKHKIQVCNLYPNVTGWTVHGIWPTKTGTRGPVYCNKSWCFDERKILDIKPLLLELWPNMFRDTPLDSFWEHEWVKHGTCAAQLRSLHSEHAYFSKGLEWVEKYNVTQVLSDARVVPSSSHTYSVDVIHSALVKGLGTEPIIDCIRAKDGRSLLSQVKVCVSLGFKLMACPYNYDDIGGIRTNCPHTGITYPDTANHVPSSDP